MNVFYLSSISGQFTLGHKEARDVRGKGHVPHKHKFHGVLQDMPETVYRVLRPDEDPSRIEPKDKTLDKTVLSHVNCGSRPGYESQFISTSATLEASEEYKELAESRGETGLRICQFVIAAVARKCTIYDLTDVNVLNECLGNAVMARNFATKYKEVLLECKGRPITCTVVEK